MKLFCAAIAMTVSFSAIVNAHEGHDHGTEPHDHAAPDTKAPPAPPSEFDVPESRPLEGNGPPPSRDRVPNFAPNRENSSRPNPRGFEPEPLEFGPAVRPRRNLPLQRDPRLNTRPGGDFGLGPQPRNLNPQSPYPLGRSSYDPCPLGNSDSSCPNHYGTTLSRPCPLDRGGIEDCPWGNGHRHDAVYQEYNPQPPAAFRGEFSRACPSGCCEPNSPCPRGYCEPTSCPSGCCEPNSRDYDYQRRENFDNSPYGSTRQPVPSFDRGGNVPVPFGTFDERSPRTFN